jgi:hypothetical protein
MSLGRDSNICRSFDNPCASVKFLNMKGRLLTNSLDSKVLNYVRDYTQLQQDSDKPAKSFGVSHLYNVLQGRDVQLRRIKKVQLEAAIQQALNILQSENISDSDLNSFDSDFEGVPDLNLVEVKVVVPNTVLIRRT